MKYSNSYNINFEFSSYLYDFSTFDHGFPMTLKIFEFFKFFFVNLDQKKAFKTYMNIQKCLRVNILKKEFAFFV